ncbi:hypothetical protein PROFUN_06103 [Planoprotostelium fungivorum]|uniref:Uncharacterized protein n=1 Tax=Planoprotostelium fungivorum TaxID=1890364 RepID=A0A2P6NPU0_9EUKA|nr:hypothetical protein PROFUN_06103 [Planoprotostelium fungivorum]
MVRSLANLLTELFAVCPVDPVYGPSCGFDVANSRYCYECPDGTECQALVNNNNVTMGLYCLRNELICTGSNFLYGGLIDKAPRSASLGYCNQYNSLTCCQPAATDQLFNLAKITSNSLSGILEQQIRTTAALFMSGLLRRYIPCLQLINVIVLFDSSMTVYRFISIGSYNSRSGTIYVANNNGLPGVQLFPRMADFFSNVTFVARNSFLDNLAACAYYFDDDPTNDYPTDRCITPYRFLKGSVSSVPPEFIIIVIVGVTCMLMLLLAVGLVYLRRRQAAIKFTEAEGDVQ